MTKRPVTVVSLPGRKKRLSDMTREEIAQYASDLIDGGLFSGVPGLSSDEADTQPEEPTP